MNASIVDLRYRMKDVLRALDRGETITVLYRGKAKAKMTPITPVSEDQDKNVPKMQDLPAFGMWKDREDMADPAAWVRKIRRPRFIFTKTGPKRRNPL